MNRKREPAAELRAAASVLGEVYRAARGTVQRWVNVQAVVDASGFRADEVEQAVALLFRQRMLVVNGTPTDSVRLTLEAQQLIRAADAYQRRR